MALEVWIRRQKYLLERPADLESLWESMDQEDFGEDERIPYWVELWPAAIQLAEWIAKHPEECRGVRCLDLGCGLGLCTCVAAQASARVVGMDLERDAVRYTRRNLTGNNASGSIVQMDWRMCGFKPGSFSLILAADVAYEKRFLEPLVSLVRQCLAPGGTILLSTPQRDAASSLFSMLQTLGWQRRLVSKERIRFGQYDMNVQLWRIKV